MIVRFDFVFQIIEFGFVTQSLLVQFCQVKNANETRIGVLRFQARCHRRRLNLVLVFLCCSTFLFIGEVCFCCIRFCFSIAGKEIGLGNVSEMAYFVLRGT